MTDEKRIEHNENRSSEHQPAVGSPITNSRDNALQTQQEKILASKALRFTVDKPFTIDMGGGEIAQDKRPLRGSLSFTDGGEATKIAQASDTGGERRPPLQGGISEVAQAVIQSADSSGVCPFGEHLSGGVSDSKVQNTSYYSAAIGYESVSKKHGKNHDLININIGDHMMVDGKPVTDGQPHHGVFPINTHEGGHYHWVEATVTPTNYNWQRERSVYNEVVINEKDYSDS